MNKLILLSAFCIIVFGMQAQTEFTYTGTGFWTNQANWAPSYPGELGLENDSYTFNIDGDCTFTGNTVNVDAQLNISGVLNLGTDGLINIENGAFLNNGVLLASKQTNFKGTTLYGSGILATIFDTPTQLSFATINPGESSPGSLSIGGYSSIQNIVFIFDIFSSTEFDNITIQNVGPNSSNNTVVINIDNSITVNQNTSFTLFTDTNTNFLNSLSLDNSSPINGFQPQLSLIGQNITLTFVDVEAPTITNCPEQNVTADCGTFYAIPDYTTITTAADNDSATTITYTQSLPAGLGAIDSTEITITATDSAGNSSDCTFILNVTEQTLRTDEIEDIVNRNISLFPNPSKGQFTLKNTSGLNLNKAELIDVKGAFIQTLNLKEFTNTQIIDLSALNPSIYFFKIYTAEGVATKKIIIE